MMWILTLTLVLIIDDTQSVLQMHSLDLRDAGPVGARAGVRVRARVRVRIGSGLRRQGSI